MVQWIRKSMARRTLFTVLLVVVVFLGGFSFYMKSTLTSFFGEMKEQDLKQDSQILAANVDGFFDRYHELVKQMSLNDEFLQMLREVKTKEQKKEHPLYPKVMDQVIRMQKADPNLGIVYLAFAESSDLISSDGYEPEPDYIVRERPWYKEMMANGKMTLSDPYLDETINKLVITISAPIVENGKDLGAVAIDFLIDDIVKMMGNYKVGENGYSTLTTAIDTVVSHPEKKYLMTKTLKDLPGFASIVTDIKGKANGITILPSGERVAFSKIPDINWLVTTVISEEEVTAEVDNFVFWILMILVGVGTLLLAVLYWTISSSLRPIPNVLQQMHKLRDGDLTARLDIQRSDEIGAIAEAMNEITDSQRNIFHTLRNISESMETTSSTLVRVSTFTNTSSQELAHAIAEIAIAITNTATDSQEGVSEVHYFGQGLDEIAKFTEVINENTESASELSKVGSKTLEKLANQSIENQQAVKVIRDIVQEMDESTKEITSIIDIISGISNQTNLLALNASIEAARAGEAGKGFSVVAEEIRKLAEQTSKSAEEINKKIGNIRQKSQIAVGYTENSGAIAEQAEQMVKETSKTFTEIAHLLQQLFAATEQNRQASKALTRSKGVMTEKIENISREVENTSAAMEEIHATTDDQQSTVNQLNNAANELYKIGVKLKEEVEKYHL